MNKPKFDVGKKELRKMLKNLEEALWSIHHFAESGVMELG
jgi:hypothetical protein